MATRRTRRSITTFVVLVLVSVLLLAFDGQASSSVSSGIKRIGSAVLSPVVGVVNTVTRPIGGFFAGAINYGSVENENARLRALVSQLEVKSASASRDQRQLAQLLALKDLPYLGSLSTVTCATTSLNVSNFAATIGLDKGTSSGVAVGMPVVGSGGLVGQVIDATSSASTVRLVTDGQSRVGAIFGKSTILGIVNGVSGNSPLSVSYVPPNSRVFRGERLLTNGLQGAQYPPGIPVGTVLSAETPINAPQMEISVKPAADLSHLGYVDVVLWETSQ